MMRRLSLFLAVFLLMPLAWAQQPVSLALQPVILQSHAAVSTGSVASLANAFSSNNLKGNTIIVVFANGNGNLAPSPVSDTNSDTYFLARTQLNGNVVVQIWYATNVAAGANTVTVTPGSSNASIASEVYEVSGLLALSPQVLDQTNSGSATSTSLTTGAVTPILPNEFAFAGFAVGTAAQTITVTNGTYTNDSGQQNPTTPAGLFSFVSASSYLASGTSTTGTATITSEPWAAAIATFRTVAVPVLNTVAQPTAANLNATVVFASAQAVTESGTWNVRAQDGAGNALTSNSSTFAAKFGLDMNLLGTLGTAFSTPGKVDVKIADGDASVRQSTGANLETAPVTTATTTDTALRCTLASAASTNSTNCKASAGNVYGYRFVNTTATLYYLRMYNSSGAPTCSSATGFVESIPIPASATGAGIVAIEPMGEGYSTGISFCFTGGSSSTDNTNAATGVFGSILYK